jgi:Flp pilus assembly protein TadG
MAPLRQFRADRRGTAALEFALVVPVLISAFIGIVDVGMALYDQLQLVNAAEAGARYAAVNGWNSGKIQTAVTGATSLSAIAASPAPSQSCGCPNGSGVAVANCGSTCSTGTMAGTYITVNAQYAYTPIIPYPGFGQSLTLTAQSMVRIQ